MRRGGLGMDVNGRRGQGVQLHGGVVHAAGQPAVERAGGPGLAHSRLAAQRAHHHSLAVPGLPRVVPAVGRSRGQRVGASMRLHHATCALTHPCAAGRGSRLRSNLQAAQVQRSRAACRRRPHIAAQQHAGSDCAAQHSTTQCSR